MFVYLPLIMDTKFEKYISETLNAAIESIAHQNENIRNLAIKIVKTIIQKFSGKHIELILKSLFDGMFSDSSLKRNSSVILLGDVIDVMFKDQLQHNKDSIYAGNQKVFSALYIVKNDENPDVKVSTSNIWKNFVENTMKCLKNIYIELTKSFVELFISGSKYHGEIARISLGEFQAKYGETFLNEIIELFKLEMMKHDPKINKGITLCKNLA